MRYYEVITEELIRDRIGVVLDNETVRQESNTYVWQADEFAAAEAQFATFVQAAMNGARIVSVTLYQWDRELPMHEQLKELRGYRGVCDVDHCEVVQYVQKSRTTGSEAVS